MRFAFFSFSGHSFSIAHRLIEEGNEVRVGQVSSPEKLGVTGWQGRKESAEERRRRLSLYTGVSGFEKYDADQLLRELAWERDKSSIFVVVDHNNLCEYGEKLVTLGFRGLIPLRSDYEREKDRKKAKEFVQKNYDILQVLLSESLKAAEDGIALVEDSDDLWVLKSNGNNAETIVPKTSDVQLNHMEITGALRSNAKDYEATGFVLEKKLRTPVEFTPQLVFWNGEPVYSQVEIECKPMGAGDTGPDGGGAINLVVRTELDDPVNEMFFPEVVAGLAPKRGLFFFDAGVLFDPETTRFYFTEFAGNRWSWGGVFSELAMATEKNRNATEYFERVAAGRNPLHYRFGATVSLYNVTPDKKFPGLEAEGSPVYWRRAADEYIWPFQVRCEAGQLVNVGCGDPLLGYASGASDSLGQCIAAVYKVVENFSFREVLFRPRSDFCSRGYSSSILNRFDAINGELFTAPGFRDAG